MLGHRFFRSAFLSLLLSGIGFSAATPQLTLYLVRELGASLPVAGLFYLTNLAAPIAGLIVGSMSDRSRNRLVIFRVCVLAGGLGWLGMALATAIWVPFVISAAVLSISSARRRAAVRRDPRRAQPQSDDRRQPGGLDHPDGVHRRLGDRPGARQLVRQRVRVALRC